MAVINCEFLPEWVINFKKNEVERKDDYKEFK